jgi:cysteine desulfuration protein SufE
LIKEEFKTENNLIKGCQSSLASREQNTDKVVFTADSDILTKGIIAILISVFSNQSPNDIIAADMNFIDK